MPTNGLRTGDARQFSREFALRRENAEALRNELKQQGINTADLDRAIDELRKLESGQNFGNPASLDQLQADAIQQLKTFEYSLYRRLGLGEEKSPTLGARAPVPAEYRADVEEYYRSLAGSQKKP